MLHTFKHAHKTYALKGERFTLSEEKPEYKVFIFKNLIRKPSIT
jgi:hypothetical protein